MTIAAIKAIMAKHNAKAVIAIGFDNDKSVYYTGEDILAENVLVKMGDEEMIATPSFIQNTKTGKYDIPVTVYKPVDNIQSVMVLNNVKDRHNIKVRDLIML